MAIFFRLILTFNATFLLLAVYWTKGGLLWAKQPIWWIWSGEAYKWINYASYMIIPLGTTATAIFFSMLLDSNSLSEGEVVEISHANNSFLPSYLGYFFVALSVGNNDTLYFVYAILFAFTFFSQALYFNPIFLLFGYKFYDVKTRSGVHIFLISRRSYRDPAHVESDRLYRINDYTFMEV